MSHQQSRSGYCHSQDSKPATTAKPRIVSRLFWQDTNASTIRCADLQRGDQWKLVTEEVAGLPKLDSESSFVQMEEVDGVLVAGVHDQQDGALQSGWLAIDTGVVKDEHGDHFHWKFQGKPRVAVSKLDTQQGNPAHVYQYDNQFFLANDKLNGFTVLDPVGLKAVSPPRSSSLLVAATLQSQPVKTKLRTRLGLIVKVTTKDASTLFP